MPRSMLLSLCMSQPKDEGEITGWPGWISHRVVRLRLEQQMRDADEGFWRCALAHSDGVSGTESEFPAST